jgi:hypothetical protein
VSYHKPPLGLKPRYLHDSDRIRELLLAIERYTWEPSEGIKYRPGQIREWAEEIAEIATHYEQAASPLKGEGEIV